LQLGNAIRPVIYELEERQEVPTEKTRILYLVRQQEVIIIDIGDRKDVYK